MTKTVIFKDERTDRVFYVTYTNNQMVGCNFHQGIDELLEEYFVPCEKMTRIYFEHARKESRLITDEILVDMLRKASDEYLTRNNQVQREIIIEAEIKITIAIMHERIIEKCFTTNNELSEAQSIVLKQAEETLRLLYIDYTNKNTVE